jgi:hypothetical protein
MLIRCIGLTCEQFAVRAQSGGCRGDGVGVGGGCLDDSGAAEVLEFSGYIAGRGVDVVMSTQFACQDAFFRAPGDCHGAESHSYCELNAEMAQAADAQDCDQITGTGAGAA